MSTLYFYEKGVREPKVLDASWINFGWLSSNLVGESFLLEENEIDAISSVMTADKWHRSNFLQALKEAKIAWKETLEKTYVVTAYGPDGMEIKQSGLKEYAKTVACNYIEKGYNNIRIKIAD